jgi:hypothetical protein
MDSLNELFAETTSRMNTRHSLPALDLASKAVLPLAARFLVAGSVWAVSTNAQEILAAIQQAFQPANDVSSAADLSIGFYVDFDRCDGERWVRPYFRALDHLYYGTYGPCDSMLVDQLNRRVIGSFSLATARDLAYWKRVILPVLLGIASACVGITPLHCGCLVKDGWGLLVCGESGAGKSTLALSLSLNGFAYLSDDCTYFTRSASEVRGWGLPVPLKLLPDAAKYFPRLLDLEPRPSLNDELAYEVDPVEVFGVNRALSCLPRWLVFVERTEEPRATFKPVSPSEMASRFAAGLEALPPCISGQREYQLATIKAIVNRECWILRHGLTPSAAAKELAEFCMP